MQCNERFLGRAMLESIKSRWTSRESPDILAWRAMLPVVYIFTSLRSRESTAPSHQSFSKSESPAH
jgi:hypothetical protein